MKCGDFGSDFLQRGRADDVGVRPLASRCCSTAAHAGENAGDRACKAEGNEAKNVGLI